MTRPARTLSINDIAISSLSIQTSNGQTQGIQLNYDALVSTLGYRMPLVKSIDIQISLLNPHTLAIDNVNSTERWLYFSDHSLGRIYRADITSSAVALLVDHAWSIHGLAVYGSSLYISSESNGTISLYNTLSNSSTTILSDLHSPRGLVVDRLNSTLYVVEKGGKIFMAKTTGMSFYGPSRAVYTQMHRLVGGNTLSRLNGISLSSDGYIYWSESNSNVIARMSLTSYTRQVILGPPRAILSWPRHVYILASNDGLYYTEYPGRISIMTIPTQSTTNVVNQVMLSSWSGQMDQLLQIPSNELLFYALE
ncbi:hypothetical protein THRCLA_02424 [Thraustotheca clavata]|uniref:Uncharacterized protein n=1 Tax=Thraustotheca clavata TaxID=74557 RepID=A0A1W0A5F2_9STRA|nr:hypothetical protein THRCLA_02424 [Thraustotheca clavata]